MSIIGAFYERGRRRSQQEIPRGRQPWNPTLKNWVARSLRFVQGAGFHGDRPV